MKKVENQAREEWEEQRWEELRAVKALATESAKTVADNAQRKCLEVFSRRKWRKRSIVARVGYGTQTETLETRARRERVRWVREKLWEKCHGERRRGWWWWQSLYQ